MSKLFVDEIVHQSSQGSGTITIGASGETTNVVGTLQNNGAGVGGTNTPSFFAYLSSDQTGNTDATVVKMNIDTEVYDTDSCYDNSVNYRFTPNVAGKYLFQAAVTVDAVSNSNGELFDTQLYKNGAVVAQSSVNARNNYIRNITPSLTVVLEANGTTDYFELYGYSDTNNNGTWTAAGFSGRYRTYFGAIKIIE